MEWNQAPSCGMKSMFKLLMCCVFYVIITIGYFILSSSSWNAVGNITTKTMQPTCMETANRSSLDKRPRFVLGILTSDDHINYRDAQRSTWLSTLHLLQNEIPFSITYKFLIDRPGNKTVLENKKHNDIVFLNVTSKGRAVKFGEKLYVWFKYIYKNYPDALLAAKVDDDVFLCVPQIFKRLDQLKSKTLYYGWTHNQGRKLNGHQYYLDEMFVVVGKDLLGRIAKRKYCTEKKCNTSIDLIDTNFADTSLVSWLSIYDDIDYVADNKMMFVMGRHKGAKILSNIKPAFCSKYVLCHKSSLEVMETLHEYNKPADFSHNGFIGSVTGPLFPGDVVRTLLPQSLTNKHKRLAILDKMPVCENWAVVTTIFSPSKAVKYIASLSNWCLVIVADKKTPLEGTYLPEIDMNNKAQKRIKYLSVKEQSILYPLLSDIIPINHFGRKNIGYIYAIHHKAKFIWDFDDDNLGTINQNDFIRDAPFHYVTVCKGAQNKLLNTYPYFGVTETYTWPRGFPLQDIKNKSTLPKLCNSSDYFQLGIVQSLANQQPDIDAIYRMTRGAPFNFSATRNSHRPFVLPRNTYAPFNAQATLWLAPAFPYLALPISVNGRVSDIWRSYIAQYFFHRKDIRLAFASPYVIQERNAHNILRDFNAELDLYQKSKQLVDFLSSEKSGNQTDLVELYNSLYMRGYIEQFDIQFAEAWTMTLASITKPV